jgi:hypothetical protein
MSSMDTAYFTKFEQVTTVKMKMSYLLYMLAGCSSGCLDVFPVDIATGLGRWLSPLKDVSSTVLSMEEEAEEH